MNPEAVGEDAFYMLDLKQPLSEMQWVEGPAFPGTSRIQSVAASHNGAFYLFSGFHLIKNVGGGFDRQLLLDAYRYSPGDFYQEGNWERLPDLPRGVAAAPSPAFSLGNSHILIPGGLDEKTLFHTDPSSHPGFPDRLLAYHSQANAWVEMGAIPEGSSRVTAPTAFWDGYWVVPNGEKAPGVRSPMVLGMETQNAFGWANWTTLGVYLCVMLGIGFYFFQKGKIPPMSIFLQVNEFPGGLRD